MVFLESVLPAIGYLAHMTRSSVAHGTYLFLVNYAVVVGILMIAEGAFRSLDHCLDQIACPFHLLFLDRLFHVRHALFVLRFRCHARDVVHPPCVDEHPPHIFLVRALCH